MDIIFTILSTKFVNPPSGKSRTCNMIDSMEIKASLDLTITRLLFLMITMHAGTPELIFVRSDLIVNSKAFKNDYILG